MLTSEGSGSAPPCPCHLIPAQLLSWEPPVASRGSSPGMGWMRFRYEVNEQDLCSSLPFPPQLRAQMSDAGVWWAGLTGMSCQKGTRDAASSLDTSRRPLTWAGARMEGLRVWPQGGHDACVGDRQPCVWRVQMWQRAWGQGPS